MKLIQKTEECSVVTARDQICLAVMGIIDALIAILTGGQYFGDFAYRYRIRMMAKWIAKRKRERDSIVRSITSDSESENPGSNPGPSTKPEKKMIAQDGKP